MNLLAVALHLTDLARTRRLPLNGSDLVTAGGGQIAGLGGASISKILSRYDIKRKFAKEAGRTSRGSLAVMHAYVKLLNDLHAEGKFDPDQIERFWIDEVRNFFTAKPFTLNLDPAKGLIFVVNEIILQAETRRKSNPGVQYTGALLQHLVGAKLECVLPGFSISHHPFSAADDQRGRHADFEINLVAIHVTTWPTSDLLDKCASNIEAGLQPLIVTLDKLVKNANDLAEHLGVQHRVDVLSAQQFLASNLYELSRFESKQRDTAVIDLIDHYNSIVASVETDPSLKIEYSVVSTRTSRF